jgi:hypothetical protein
MQVNTLRYKMSRLSRLKGVIGTMAATLALTGAVQAAAPVSASALPRMTVGECWQVYNLAVKSRDEGNMDGYLKALNVFYANECDGILEGSL